MKKILVLLIAALAATGCVSRSKPVFAQHYTIAAASSGGAGAAPAQGPVLRVADIDAPGWLDATNMYYRLAYKNDAQVSAYSQSDWVAPPPQLLARMLQNALAGPPWSAVIGSGATASADRTLRIELSDFQQVFSAAKQSAGIIDATATLIDDHANRVEAQRHFHVEQPAPSADAAGGAKALDAATRQFANDLKTWLAQQQHSAAG